MLRVRIRTLFWPRRMLRMFSQTHLGQPTDHAHFWGAGFGSRPGMFGRAAVLGGSWCALFRLGGLWVLPAVALGYRTSWRFLLGVALASFHVLGISGGGDPWVMSRAGEFWWECSPPYLMNLYIHIYIYIIFDIWLCHIYLRIYIYSYVLYTYALGYIFYMHHHCYHYVFVIVLCISLYIYTCV